MHVLSPPCKSPARDPILFCLSCKRSTILSLMQENSYYSVSHERDNYSVSHPIVLLLFCLSCKRSPTILSLMQEISYYSVSHAYDRLLFVRLLIKSSHLYQCLYISCLPYFVALVWFLYMCISF